MVSHTIELTDDEDVAFQDWLARENAREGRSVPLTAATGLRELLASSLVNVQQDYAQRRRRRLTKAFDQASPELQATIAAQLKVDEVDVE